MFEARFTQGDLLKRVIDSMKDLVGDANFDCSAAGVSLQAMDATHVSVVEVLLRADGFAHYRCDRGLTMGMHIGSLSKILKVRVPRALPPSADRTRSVVGVSWDARLRRLPSQNVDCPHSVSETRARLVECRNDSTPSTPLLPAGVSCTCQLQGLSTDCRKHRDGCPSRAGALALGVELCLRTITACVDCA